jgi:hypothetical protein
MDIIDFGEKGRCNAEKLRRHEKKPIFSITTFDAFIFTPRYIFTYFSGAGRSNCSMGAYLIEICGHSIL